MKSTTEPARLVVSLLASLEEPRQEALRRLARRFGPVVFYSEPLAFDHSDYYAAELGSPLTRRLAAFARLIPAGKLAWAKLLCRSLEGDLARHGRRSVNLDPGVLNAGALTLATGKPGDWRVPIGPGVYADVHLRFEDGRYQSLPWTYTDYAHGPLNDIMSDIRARYLWQLKQAGAQEKNQ